MNTHPAARNIETTVGNIRSFLLAAEALPSPRGVALQLVEQARDPNASIDDVVRVIRADPALSAFVLHAAHTARFGRSDRPLDLKHAVLRLGMNLVRAHALALSLATGARPQRCTQFDYDAFWTSSLLSAAAMAALAARDDTIPAADAFTLGLVGNIGQLAFATAAPDAYADVLLRARTEPAALEALEQSAFGFDHHELSSVLLANWSMPTALADVVYWQCDPEGGGFAPDSRPHRLACGLQLATLLARTCLAPTGKPEDVSMIHLRAAIAGLSPEETHALAEEALRELPQWMKLVGLPMPVLHPLPPAWS